MKYILGLFICLLSFNSFALTVTLPKVYELDTLIEMWNIQDKIDRTKDKEITIICDGYGGVVIMGGNIVASIQKAQARGIHVTTVVNEFAASAAAMIATYGDTIQLKPGAELYFHSMFYCNGKKKMYDYNPYSLSGKVWNNWLAHVVEARVLTVTDVYVISTKHGVVEVMRLGDGTLVKQARAQTKQEEVCPV